MNTPYFLILITGIIALISLYISPRAVSADGFFKGTSPSGKTPGLWTLVFSQTTTWIFARSLMNAAILGFYFGLWGTIAYAAYYLSFLTGAKIIDSLRFEHGFQSVQDFLRVKFGRSGTRCYNFVIGLRLVSEVFANLLVIGILFGAAGSQFYIISILFFSIVALAYSCLGGLHASLRTDVFQMGLFIIVLAVLMLVLFNADGFTTQQLLFKPFVITEPGPVLLMVALLQVWGYPMHDPVMMDRGFIADRSTTRRSFYHAAWISILCIGSFGLLGVYAGASQLEGEDMTTALTRLLGEWPMIIFSVSLIISAMSTLDSTLSSSAKLIVKDMKLASANIKNGRIVMILFLMAGLACVFFGSQDLFSAVAVSGTASMYLIPVVFFSLWAKWDDIPVWSYLVSFTVAVGGAILYFFESSNYSNMIGLIGIDHKYSKLLLICIVILIISCGAFIVGRILNVKCRADNLVNN